MFFIFLSYISANQKVQGGKKPQPYGFYSLRWKRWFTTPLWREGEWNMCVKLDASVLEFGLDLGLGQGQDNTRLGIIILGLRPT